MQASDTGVVEDFGNSTRSGQSLSKLADYYTNSAPDLLQLLESWYESRMDSPVSHNCVIEFERYNRTSDNPSASVFVGTPRRPAKLTVWSSGETELDLANVYSGDVIQQHREISGAVGRTDATDSVLAWVGGDLIRRLPAQP